MYTNVCHTLQYFLHIHDHESRLCDYDNACLKYFLFQNNFRFHRLLFYVFIIRIRIITITPTLYVNVCM